ncbi:MAG: acetylglutamate kinase [Alphaproteobacteria bacterium]
MHREVEAYLRQAGILSEALPYLERYQGTNIVIKYGGSAMGDPALAKSFAEDVVLLKRADINPIIVHGGGPQIGEMLERLSIKSEFIDGLRVTDKETVEIVEMILAGSINKKIVTEIQSAGGKAVGLCGKDDNLIRAKKLVRTKRDPDSNIEKVLDLGFVGEPEAINPDIIHALAGSGIIPVIAPIGMGENGETYNINADTSAGAIAAAIKAVRFFLLTDVDGVLDKNKALVKDMCADKMQEFIADETIMGGMIPKVLTCIQAVEAGVDASVIVNGTRKHAIIHDLFTNDGVGTLIKR